MVFDFRGPPVNAYANKFYRQMKPYILRTDVTDTRERSFDLDPRCYPDPVTDVTLRITHVKDVSDERADVTSVTYDENWSGDHWECRWGRHDNSHNSREHFHYPPSPDENDDPYAYDADYRSDALLMETPIKFILARMNDLATSNHYTYPSDYRWTMEYPGTYHPP